MEEKENIDESKNVKGNDSYSFTKVNVSSSKVNVANHISSHINSAITKLTFSLSNSSLRSWIV